MKLLFDILPIFLFFLTFKSAEHFEGQSLELAQSILGDGVTALTAPVFLATIVGIAATAFQIAYLKAVGRKGEPMLWISLAVIVVFGGLTLYLKNEMFIKWKPTILYWVFGGILLYGRISGRNFIKNLMKAQIDMPEAAWTKLQTMWIVFFAVIGVVNLFVVYSFSTDVWVNFKLFGLLALTMIFTIAVAVWITRHAVERQN